MTYPRLLVTSRGELDGEIGFAGVLVTRYTAEKVETSAGWQFVSPDEDWMRGYPQEVEDFVSAIADRREPLSGAEPAYDTVDVIYAGYASAEQGRRVMLSEAPTG